MIERVFSNVAASSCAPSGASRDAAAARPPGTSGALPDVITDVANPLSDIVAEMIWNDPSPSISIGTAPASSASRYFSFSLPSTSCSCAGVRPHSIRKCIRPPLTPSRFSVVNFRNRNSGVPSGRAATRNPTGR